jgi:hypothetical protein
VKSAAHYTETALDEIKLLKCVSNICMLLYECGSHFDNNRDHAIESVLCEVCILTVAALCTVYIDDINFVKYIVLYFYTWHPVV